MVQLIELEREEARPLQRDLSCPGEWIPVPRGLQAEAGRLWGGTGMWQSILVVFKAFPPWTF